MPAHSPTAHVTHPPPHAYAVAAAAVATRHHTDNHHTPRAHARSATHLSAIQQARSNAIRPARQCRPLAVPDSRTQQSVEARASLLKRLGTKLLPSSSSLLSSSSETQTTSHRAVPHPSRWRVMGSLNQFLPGRLRPPFTETLNRSPTRRRASTTTPAVLNTSTFFCPVTQHVEQND